MRLEWLLGGPHDLRQLLYHGRLEEEPLFVPVARTRPERKLLYPLPLAGLEAIRPTDGWSHIHIPGRQVSGTV